MQNSLKRLYNFILEQLGVGPSKTRMTSKSYQEGNPHYNQALTENIWQGKIGKHTKIYNSALSNIRNCQIGDNCVIHSHVWIGDHVVIGNNVRVQAFSFIPEGVIIEDNVFIGPRVTFTNDKYPPSKKEDWKQTHVLEGASLGAGVVVLPGITIGRNSKIGAGSVVTKDVPDNCVACGNPCRVMAGKK